MASSGDTWRTVRVPKQSLWVPCKAAGLEFARAVPRHSRPTLFDTRQHIAKGCRLPEPLCTERSNRSKCSLPNLSITSLSKVWDRKLDPLSFTKSLPKNPSSGSFDRMLRGKSLMSTAEYYELKRRYEGRPYTPPQRTPCRLRAMPRARSITETLEQTMYYLQRPVTLLPQRSKHDPWRTKPRVGRRAESLADSKSGLSKVQDEASQLKFPSSALGLTKHAVESKSPYNIMPTTQGPHRPVSHYEYQMIPPSSQANHKSYLRSKGLPQIAGTETFHAQRAASGQFIIPRANEGVMLDLPESRSLILRQTTPSSLTCFPQLIGTNRFEPKLDIQKPEAPAKLRVIGNNPQCLFDLSDSSTRLAVTPRTTPHCDDVVLETQLLIPSREYDFNVTGRKMENKSNIPITNFLNNTRDYRLGHVVSKGQTCNRMSSHWTANDLQTLSLQKLKNGSPGLLDQILPRSREEDERSMQTGLLSVNSPADPQSNQTFDYFVSSGQLWQRDESTVKDTSSSSPSECESSSSGASSSLSIRSSESDLAEHQAEKSKSEDQNLRIERTGEPNEKTEADVINTAKSKPFLRTRHKVVETPKTNRTNSPKLQYIKACGRISPLPFPSRKLSKARNEEQILAAQGHPVVFASSTSTLSALPPYRSPLPFSNKYKSSTSKWRVPNVFDSINRPQHTNNADKIVKVQVTQKKPDKKQKIWRRKKRRHNMDTLSFYEDKTYTSSRTGAASENKFEASRSSNFLCFTPIYDLRYDKWKRQCNTRKGATSCNLSIKATATPSRKLFDSSALNFGSDSDDSEDSCDSDAEGEEEEEECRYISPGRRTEDGNRTSRSVREKEREVHSVTSIHLPDITRPQTNGGATSSLGPSPSICGRRDGELEVRGQACTSSERLGLRSADKTPSSPIKEDNRTAIQRAQSVLDGHVEDQNISVEEMARSAEEVVLSSSELFELESTGRVCTCSSGCETIESADVDARPDFWNITGILRGKKRQKRKQTTVGEFLELSRCSPRDLRRLSSSTAVSPVWLTDSLSVTAIGTGTPATTGISRENQVSPRKMAEESKTGEGRRSRSITLQKILGFLPNIGIVQAITGEQCEHDLSERRSGVTPCRSCLCKTAQAQTSSHCCPTDIQPEPAKDATCHNTSSFTLPVPPSKRSSNHSLPIV